MIKEIEVTIGQIGALSLPGIADIGVPIIAPGQVIASGYYTVAGQDYYYNAHTDQWYVVAAGYLYPLAISWQASPSTKLELTENDIIRFKLRFYYLGPAVTRTFYAALGKNKTTGTFEEWSGCTAQKSIALPDCNSATLFTDKYVDIQIPDWSWFQTWNHAGETFAAYVKILNGITLIEGVNCSPLYYNVGYVIQEEGEFSQFTITSIAKTG